MSTRWAKHKSPGYEVYHLARPGKIGKLFYIDVVYHVGHQAGFDDYYCHELQLPSESVAFVRTPRLLHKACSSLLSVDQSRRFVAHHHM